MFTFSLTALVAKTASLPKNQNVILSHDYDRGRELVVLSLVYSISNGKN